MTEAVAAAPERAEVMYTNAGACPCGRPLPAIAEGTKGRRPRFCSRCREERKALRFTRAATRILENLRDPEWGGGA